jgi:threonine/homoserine/homoserine lactone efflux protein
MLTWQELGWFALATFAMALTPGPNMIYCVSRTLSQGRAAGMVSLAGVLLGFFVHLLAAAFGLTALLLAVPVAFTALKLAGAAYLLWLAWQAVKPGGTTPFQARVLPPHSTATLFRMGFITNVLNPKVAMFAIAIMPQFIHPERGSPLLQALQLGAVQITASGFVNTLVIFGAAGITTLLSRSQRWLDAQRYVMGAVLGGLAVRIALVEQK